MRILDYDGFRLWRPETVPEQVVESVRKIVSDVKVRGDAALLEYTERFDGVKISAKEILVDPPELRGAYDSMPEEVKRSLSNSAERIRMFQARQVPESFAIETAPGLSVGVRFMPISSAGAYIPGGRAAYLSTVLMTVLPAKVAGVSRCAVSTPPKEGGRVPDAILAAAYVTGADSVYRVGGPQAIAAMAYGTESVRRVEKIVGPGNIYVTVAKMLVSWDVAVDMPAGPSELVVYADVDDPKICEWLAADLLAQAEHDPRAKVILITPRVEVASKIEGFVERDIGEFGKEEILNESLSNACIVLVKNRQEAVRLINEIAPEHLELICEDADEVLNQIENAGAIFLGEYSPVAIGDYTAGTNHVLPTMGWAKRASPLSVRDFLKANEIVKCTKDGLLSVSADGKVLADAERMPYHAKSIILRTGEL
ncbi:MAG: histidinol dehydrogenase [Candidatus Methanomethylicia archaeon]|jgi:histidinol dehydrogenase|nr:histidinol dehydrogenase [Candidatus Methanomethylicia archaeon]